MEGKIQVIYKVYYTAGTLKQQLKLRYFLKVDNFILPLISDEIDQEVSIRKMNISEVQIDIQQEVTDREEGDNILNGNDYKLNYELCFL